VSVLVRKIPASLFVLGQLFIRAVEQFRIRPNEAKLKSEDIGQHQSRVKTLREEYKKYQRARRYQRQDYSNAYTFREVDSPYIIVRQVATPKADHSPKPKRIALQPFCFDAKLSCIFGVFRRWKK